MKLRLIVVVLLSLCVLVLAQTRMTSLAITRSTIDSTPIGVTTPSEGHFTNLTFDTASLSSNVKAVNISPSCTTPNGSSYSTCLTVLTWPTPFADANYAVSCSGVGPSDGRAAMNVKSFDQNTVTVSVVTMGSMAIHFNSVSCVGVHP